ncbi:MAG TPA: electron transport complex subunit RsxB [Burkholderiaceae bacterium]|nr:electron transport complex subunit RsxB [Burkholderiaceae bacterium]
MSADDLADRLNDALPQTQCTRCGYPDCRHYARAIAAGEADINRCPPGGAEGIARLARISGRPPLALDPACGAEGPLRLARIDEAACIGCTLCIEACPVDCILGAPRRMHTVIAEQCSGCELCVPACPVDCIAMIDVSSPRTGWAAWSAAQAAQARARHAARRARLDREQAQAEARLRAAARTRAAAPARPANAASRPAADAQAIIEAALARARQLREPPR